MVAIAESATLYRESRIDGPFSFGDFDMSIHDELADLRKRVEALEAFYKPQIHTTAIPSGDVGSSQWVGATNMASLSDDARMIEEANNGFVKDIPQSVMDDIEKAIVGESIIDWCLCEDQPQIGPGFVVRENCKDCGKVRLRNAVVKVKKLADDVTGKTLIATECTCDVLHWDDRADKMKHEPRCPLAKG
jgi:hypothetical protein